MADVNFLMPPMNNNTLIRPRTQFTFLPKQTAFRSSDISIFFLFALASSRDTNLQFLVLEFTFSLFFSWSVNVATLSSGVHASITRRAKLILYTIRIVMNSGQITIETVVK